MENEKKAVAIDVEVTRRDAIKLGALTAAGAMLTIAGAGIARPGEALAHTTSYIGADGKTHWFDDDCGLTNAEVPGSSAPKNWKPAFTATQWGKAKFKKLKATDAQCEKIANLVVSEWGNLTEHVAYGTSVIANNFELHGKKYSNVYNFVRKSGYFAHAAEHMDTASANKMTVAIVKAVLTQGKRTLPGYIDSYELSSDIKYAKTGNKRVTSKSALLRDSTYQMHKTTVGVDLGSKFTFYRWLGPNIVGYTSMKARKKYGDGHWILKN